MPDQASGSGQDDELAAASASGQPHLDYQALLEALAAGGFLDENPEDQELAAAEEQAAVAEGRMSRPLPPAALGALAAEHMPPGPAQAGWLAAAAGTTSDLDEYELAGVAIAARQLASWAQAAELTAVAQITARAAAADPDIGLKADGRPAKLCRDALGQVSLALMLTDYGATAWGDLAVTLTWRLPDTGAALADGRIDLARAKAIAEATSVLSEPAARAVEAKILPGARGQTCARLQARLTSWATASGMSISEVVTEVGSALGGRRRKLRRLPADPAAAQIAVEHRDRLAPFGVEHLQAALAAQNRRVLILDQVEVDDDLVRCAESPGDPGA